MIKEKELNSEIVEISKVELEEISKALDAYSEEGELYRDFGIEEDSTINSFKVEFDSGYVCYIDIKSGQCNCYVDYIFQNQEGREVTAIVGDDTLCDGDILEFEVDDIDFKIIIKAI